MAYRVSNLARCRRHEAKKPSGSVKKGGAGCLASSVLMFTAWGEAGLRRICVWPTLEVKRGKGVKGGFSPIFQGF